MQLYQQYSPRPARHRHPLVQVQRSRTHPQPVPHQIPCCKIVVLDSCYIRGTYIKEREREREH